MRKNTKEYCLNLNACEAILVFVNKVLQIPGIDFIRKDRSSSEGTFLIFKKKLENGDLLTIYDRSSGACWYLVEKGELVDVSGDRPGGLNENDWYAGELGQ